MLAYLFEHVVEEAQARVDVAFARAVEVQFDADVRFLCGAPGFGGALSGKQQFGYLVPRQSVFAQYESLAANVLGKLAVGVAVADDIAVGHVIFLVVHILAHKSSGRFARVGVVLGKVAVYENVVEGDAFAIECLQYEVVYWPKRVFRKRTCAESILV